MRSDPFGLIDVDWGDEPELIFRDFEKEEHEYDLDDLPFDDTDTCPECGGQMSENECVVCGWQDEKLFEELV